MCLKNIIIVINNPNIKFLHIRLGSFGSNISPYFAVILQHRKRGSGGVWEQVNNNDTIRISKVCAITSAFTNIWEKIDR
jgi:hypothetical protein